MQSTANRIWFFTAVMSICQRRVESLNVCPLWVSKPALRRHSSLNSSNSCQVSTLATWRKVPSCTASSASLNREDGPSIAPEGFWRPVRLVRTSFATSDVVLAVCDIASKLTGVRLIVCLRVSIMMLATNEEPYSLGDLYWRPCKSQHEHRDSYQIEYLSRIAHWADIIEWLYSRESSAGETHHHQDKNGEGPET